MGHECVFASELDEELRRLYIQNFAEVASNTFGDIRDFKQLVPQHDVLCAGFPCQPFSKSGSQEGVLDKTRGTLFHVIIEILGRHRPEFVLLENVGNFEQHDEGNTWRVAKRSLERLGYAVQATVHVKSGGEGLLSPHHFGYPHSRERFFIVARLGGLPAATLPAPNRFAACDLADVIQEPSTLTENDLLETRLTSQQIECIDHWNELIRELPADRELPSFPIWGDEFGASYPFETTTPGRLPKQALVSHTYRRGGRHTMTKLELMQLLPSYARERTFPYWKQQFIRQNREWFMENRSVITTSWMKRLKEFPPSLRKLEWNCHGEVRDLYQHVLQFRPSGLRVKRMRSAPALVSMTTTQIPIVGPQRRFITRTEGLRLQGFPDDHQLPRARRDAFAALGNAVHVKLVRLLAEKLLAVRSVEGALQRVS